VSIHPALHHSGDRILGVCRCSYPTQVVDSALFDCYVTATATVRCCTLLAAAAGLQRGIMNDSESPLFSLLSLPSLSPLSLSSLSLSLFSQLTSSSVPSQGSLLVVSLYPACQIVHLESCPIIISSSTSSSGLLLCPFLPRVRILTTPKKSIRLEIGTPVVVCPISPQKLAPQKCWWQTQLTPDWWDSGEPNITSVVGYPLGWV
jgi:hypothetical protein